MSSRKVALLPLNLTPCGPERLRLASTLSSFREERHLAKTASPKIHTERGVGETRMERDDYVSICTQDFLKPVTKMYYIGYSDQSQTPAVLHSKENNAQGSA